MSSGPPLSRLMSSQVIVDHTATLLLKAEQLMYFEWWWANKINHGNNYFKITLMTSTGMNTVVAAFSKNGKGAAIMSGLYYRLVCNLTALELPSLAIPEDLAKNVAKQNGLKMP